MAGSRWQEADGRKQMTGRRLQIAENKKIRIFSGFFIY